MNKFEQEDGLQDRLEFMGIDQTATDRIMAIPPLAESIWPVHWTAFMTNWRKCQKCQNSSQIRHTWTARRAANRITGRPSQPAASTVGQNSEQAQKARSNTERVSQMAEEGGAVMVQATNAMDRSLSPRRKFPTSSA